jgi:hypothetical protein
MEAGTGKSMCSCTMMSKQHEIINIVKKLFGNVRTWEVTATSEISKYVLVD